MKWSKSMQDRAQAEITACAHAAAAELGATSVLMVVAYVNHIDSSIHIEVGGQSPIPPEAFLDQTLMMMRKGGADEQEPRRLPTDDKGPQTRQ